jgi:alkylation response protein AidB-like acyl-CoA dehydrogenase
LTTRGTVLISYSKLLLAFGISEGKAAIATERVIECLGGHSYTVEAFNI